ncbi:MAG TPA: sigma-70 family RNA polymerase sigma factor, partial [Rhizobacter sp.]|nr:sigma-70 family RNA polymerase sigma factor [Rhizobacter sp.]
MSAAPEPTDDELMAAYARGDAAAFERLYTRHQAGLYRFIRRLLGSTLTAQTDEVFQDTWLKVVNARAQWQPQGASFRTWLFTLANHRVIDIWRRSGREVSLATDDDTAAPWEPESGAAWQQWPAPAPQGEDIAF